MFSQDYEYVVDYYFTENFTLQIIFKNKWQLMDANIILLCVINESQMLI